MRGYADKGSAYPISVIPKGNGTFDVKNLETGVIHGNFDDPVAAGDEQERQRQALFAKRQAS